MSQRNTIPWFLPETGKRDLEQVAKVIESNYINDGEITRKFEKSVASFIGVRHCVAVTSGTTAISLALMASGIGPGDEVIVPDLTFIATANAVLLCGAKVKLVDIDPRTFTVDPEKLIEAIGSSTRAVVTVDVNGRGADYSAIEPVCRENSIVLICDSAEALGSKYKGRFLGTFGEAGCFSFSPNKTVTCGQGGMIATDNTDLYHRLLELKDQGRRKQGSGGDDLHPVIGYNFKLTNLQAAIGLAQFEKLPSRLDTFRQRDQRYAELLDNVPGLTLPPMKMERGEVHQWMDILIDKRTSVQNALKNSGIGHRAFWHPLHRQKPYAQGDWEFENTISASARGLWLPSYFNLTVEEIERTCGVIRQALFV
ncbi:MAG: DegT/DnrJ/EryC1/StrS family aminotransferase [Promethearchaeota archaeon]|jgi:perosamine synthetase